MEKVADRCTNEDGIICSESGPSNCGNTCLASTTNHYFQYSFTGVQFQIYATKKNDYGKFSVLIDENIEEVDTHSETTELRILVYTSPYLAYDKHTIRVQGLGDPFEIYKLAFLPTQYVSRLNLKITWLTINKNHQNC